MTQYLLSIIQPDGEPPAPDALAAIMADVTSVRDAMIASGSWVASVGLHPASTATVVRSRGTDAPLITDGPYAEGKEHVGGFTIVAADDLDAALEWASKLSRATTLPVEVRPIRF